MEYHFQKKLIETISLKHLPTIFKDLWIRGKDSGL